MDHKGVHYIVVNLPGEMADMTFEQWSYVLADGVLYHNGIPVSNIDLIETVALEEDTHG